MQDQSGIGQDGTEAERGQGRPNPADDHVSAVAPAEDEPTDHAIVTEEDKAARADISQM